MPADPTENPENNVWKFWRKTGLSAKSNALVKTLPLLDRKRLELAKALATDPKVLLVDEVAGGLTEKEVEEFSNHHSWGSQRRG